MWCMWLHRFSVIHKRGWVSLFITKDRGAAQPAQCTATLYGLMHTLSMFSYQKSLYVGTFWCLHASRLCMFLQWRKSVAGVIEAYSCLDQHA